MKSAGSVPGTFNAAQAAPAPTPADAVFSNTILVADDDPSTLRLVEYTLTRAGYDVRLAENGEQAMSILAECKPALILLDCDMPKLDGLEVCRQVKRDPLLAGIPVVFLTALVSPADKARGYAAGGDDYVVKPLERVELLTRIRKQLELSRTQAQIHQQAMLLNAHAGRASEARSTQQSLMTDLSGFAELKLGLHYHPAPETTGDFYEVHRLASQEYGLLVAEAAGESIRGCFLVGVMKALTTTFLNPSLSVQETLVLLNAALHKCLGPHHQINACYSRFDRSTRGIEIGCAGSLTPLLVSQDGQCRAIEACGDPLGVHEDAAFEPETLIVEPGQRLFLFTTGLVADDVAPMGRLELLKQQLGLHRKEPIAQAVAAAAQWLQTDTRSAARRDHLLLGLAC